MGNICEERDRMATHIDLPVNGIRTATIEALDDAASYFYTANAGRSTAYETWSREELMQRAEHLGLRDGHVLDRATLIERLRDSQRATTW